jgi:UDP-N-acetyl-D-glucosamine dehydrogenase
MDNVLIEKIKRKEVKICVIGLGYVGLPLLKLCQEKGFSAIGLDIDQKAVDNAINAGASATLDAEYSLNDSDCIFICVPTPLDKSNRPDLQHVESAAKTISKFLKKDSLVVLESTVAPGTTEEILGPILKGSSLKNEDFYLVHCPERIDPGNEKWTVKNLPRIIGGINQKSTKIAVELYKKIIDREIQELSSVKAAEAVKIVENAFRDINIAFVNELAKSCDKFRIDISEVIKGATTKPFGFMAHYPGCGVGGHCIAVDPYYLINKAEESGFNHQFLKLAREINNSMPKYTVKKVKQAFKKAKKKIKDSNVTILGLAYKPDVSDVRGSPAFPIIKELEKLGAILTIYDPYLLELSNVNSLENALYKKDCIVLTTAHKEFFKLTPEKLKENDIRVVVDGRNIFDKTKIKKLGIIYEGIGK